jgi:hypothetical protein
MVLPNRVYEQARVAEKGAPSGPKNASAGGTVKKVDGRTQQGKALKVYAGVVQLFCYDCNALVSCCAPAEARNECVAASVAASF